MGASRKGEEDYIIYGLLAIDSCILPLALRDLMNEMHDRM
jgi:hypothetical protein